MKRDLVRVGNTGRPARCACAGCSRRRPPTPSKGVHDRAILATLLYHGMRHEELCGLRVRDIQSCQGVMHFRIKGKRDKIRFVPVHVTAQRTVLHRNFSQRPNEF
jgi:integrase